MKTNLFKQAIVLCLFAQSLMAQPYVSMLNNNPSWNIAIATFGGQQNRVINSGVDVTIGSFTYKKITDTYSNTDVYLREDVSAKKVYRRVNNTDQLLYDFSLTNGSSITLVNGFTYSVTVNTIPVNGGTRKSIYLYNDIAPSETWVEGVGNSRHPLKPTYELLSDPYVYLTCSAQNGINVYNFALANGQPTATDCSMLSTGDFNYTELSFVPNPFSRSCTLTTDFDFQDVTIEIFNSIGQLIQEMNQLQGREIVINNNQWQAGVYLVQITSGQQLLARKKIVVQY